MIRKVVLAVMAALVLSAASDAAHCAGQGNTGTTGPASSDNWIASARNFGGDAACAVSNDEAGAAPAMTQWTLPDEDGTSWQGYLATPRDLGDAGQLLLCARTDGSAADAAFANVSISGGGTPVPEPSGWILLLAGVGGMGATLRSQRRSEARACS
jgi:hypothetical protein